MSWFWIIVCVVSLIVVINLYFLVEMVVDALRRPWLHKPPHNPLW